LSKQKKTKLTSTPSTFVQKYQNIFIVISVLLIILEIVVSSFRAAYYDVGTLTTITGVIYIVVILVITVFFEVCGILVYKQLRKVTVIGNKQQRVEKTTLRVMLNGVSNIFWIIVVAMMGLSDAFEKAWGFYVLLFLNNVMLAIGSLLQILSFNVKKKKTKHVSKSSSSSSSSSSSASTSTSASSPTNQE